MAAEIHVDFSNINMGGAGFAAGATGGGQASSPKGSDKAVLRELDQLNKKSKKSLGATLGIKFGTASLLKQSQVFTGVIGTIFQLMGALVDVILAPFLPIIIPAIRLMADLIPYVSKYTQNIFDFLDRTLFEWLRNFGDILPGSMGENMKKALAAIILGVFFLRMTGLWNPFWRAIQLFIGKPMWGLLKAMFPQIDSLLAKFAGKTISQIILSAGKAALTGVWEMTGGKIWKIISEFTPVKAVITGIKSLADTAALKLMFLADDFAKRPFATLMGVLAAPFKLIFENAGNKIIEWGKQAFRLLPDAIQTRFLSTMTNIRNLPGQILGFITKGISEISRYLQKLFNWLPESLIARLKNMKVVTAIMKWVGKELTGKIGGLLKGAGRLGMSAAGKIGLKGAAQGLKAVPVLGAAAELGFGAWQTYQDYKKYGAGAALGRAGLTMANTTAALFDPSGIASAAGSIATNVAMSEAYKRTLDPKESWKRDNPELYISIKDEWGVETFVKRNDQDANRGVEAAQGMAKDRVTTRE